MEGIDRDVLFFFEGRPAELEIYLELESAIRSAFPQARAKVGKTQIGFAEKHNFAFASLPLRRVKGRPDHCLIVTFGLGYRKDSPRIEQAVEPYRNRWTHHVIAAVPSDIDGELMDWIRESREFSAAKR